MCAVVGAILIEPSKEDLLMLQRVFLESKIRGKHATGIAYVKHDKVIIEKHPVPADKFPFNFSNYVNEDGNLYLIGHCRYSTSDLEYNQPIGDDASAIVHNGVITQELPENWKSLYGYDCITKNDSELVLHSENPLQEFANMSMGVCELNSNKTMRVYRNGKRPLHLTAIPNGSIITSTEDIAKRANIGGVTVATPLSTYLTFDEHNVVMMEIINPLAKEYQYGLSE